MNYKAKKYKPIKIYYNALIKSIYKRSSFYINLLYPY